MATLTQNPPALVSESVAAPAGTFAWRGRDVAVVFLASLVSHIYTGIEYGTGAHAAQLVRVFSLVDPALYPRDMYVETLHQYCSYYWVAVAWLARWVDPFWTLLASHVLSRFALLAASFELSARMFAARPVRYIALALSGLHLRAILAGEVLIAPLPTHTTFAFPFIVWALLFAWRGRWYVAALLLGLACNLNVMTALPATFVIAVSSALTLSSAGPTAARKRLAAFAGAGLLWLIVALPALRWAWRSPAPDVDPSTYNDAIRSIFWWHFDPARWGLSVAIRLSGLLLVIVLAMRFKPPTPFERPIYGALVAIALTWLGALAASRLSFAAPLMRLQLARTATLAVILSIPLAAAAVYVLWNRRDFVAAMVLVLLAAGWAAAHGATVAAILLCVAVLADALSTRSWLTSFAPRAARPAIVAASLAGLALFSTRLVRSVGRSGESSGRLLRTLDESWLDVQAWAMANTPRDSLFVGPVQRGGTFRIFSRRSYWLGFDFDAMLWRPDRTSEFLRRHDRIRPTGLDAPGVTRVDWPALYELAAAERIDYAVVPAATLDSRPTVYRNENWAVVDLRVGG